MSAKLERLTRTLINLRFVPRENIESWVDVCTLIPSSVDHGEYYELCRMHYRCTLLVERYQGDCRLISSWVASWLKDYDGDRDHDQMPDPEIDIEALDASGTQWDVDLSIEFVEPILIVPANDGVITWKGQQWQLIDQPVVDTAEQLENVTQINPGEGTS